MTVPPTRTPVRIARGSYANLTTVDALASLAEGELAFATDTDQLYVKKGAVLVPVSSSGGGFSGDYDDLTNKPDIPSSTSDLVNDSGYITAAEAPVQVSDIPTNNNQLLNGAGYITAAEAPVQPGDTFSGDYNDLTNKPSIPPAYDDTALAARVTANEGDITQLQSDVSNIDTFSGDYNDLTNKPTIPPAYDDSAIDARVTQNESDITVLQAQVNNIDLTLLNTLP